MTLALYGLFAVWCLMTGLWIASLIRRDSSIVDPFWGMGFVMLAWVYFALTPDGFMARKLLLAGLVSVWGLRLSIYLTWRNWGHGEDFRYQAWRAEHGQRWPLRSYFQVYLLQGGLMWLIAMPLLFAQLSPRPEQLTLLDGLGIVVWGLGFFFEAAGDWQLARFKADPANKGRVLDTGVWRYTRHPNYFGDAAQWWGYFLIALATPGGWITIFAPVMMTGLLLKVSGVALLEKTLVESKPQYREYIQRTSAFFPLPPRPSAGE